MNIEKISPLNFYGKSPENLKQIVVSGQKAGQTLVCKYEGDITNNLTALGYDFVEINNGTRKTLDSVLIKNKNGIDVESIAALCDRMQKYTGDTCDIIFELFKHSTKSR